MADINYAKSFAGDDRQFAASYLGTNYANQIRGIEHFLASYLKTYLGDYTKTYLGQYEKQWGKQYDGVWLGVYSKQYSKEYSKAYEGSFTSQFEGQFGNSFSKTYEGAFNKQFEGAFTGYYNKSYIAVYSRQFAKQFLGGPYLVMYEGAFEGTFASGLSYSKTYTKTYEGVYEGVYTTQYEKAYLGQYEGTFEGSFDAQYSKQWTKHYSKDYEGIFNSYRSENLNYIAHYGREYLKQYHKSYYKVWLKTYIGNYEAQWTGHYGKAWSVSSQYEGIYYSGTAYTRTITVSFSEDPYDDDIEGFEGPVELGFSAQYSKSWSGDIGYSRLFVNSVEQGAGIPAQILNYSDGGGTNYASGSSGSYLNAQGVSWEAGNNREFGTLYYTSGGTVWSSAVLLGGTFITQYTGAQIRAYIGGYVSSYGNEVELAEELEGWQGSTGVYYMQEGYAAHNIDEDAVAFYLGTTGNVATYSKTYLDNEATLWIKSFPTNIYLGAWSNARTGYLGVNSGLNSVAHYAGQYTKSWMHSTTLAYGASDHLGWSRSYQKGYLKHYEKTWTTIGYYIGYYTGIYTKQYSKAYEKIYSKVWVGQYSRLFEGSFVKQYEKAYTGQYIGQYNKDYVKTYTQHWSGVYSRQFQGPALYNASANGNFTGLVTHNFEKNYIKAYEGVYLGQYTGTFIGQYIKQYGALFTGQYEGAFVGVYNKVYVKQYTKEYEGQYGAQFGKVYSKLYEGAFNKTYVGAYVKAYGGVYQGAYASIGDTLRFVSNFAGPQTFHTSYVTTTAIANTKSGELTDGGGLIRVKDASIWKQAKDIKIKENDAWRDVSIVRKKEDGQWKITGVNYERTDITLSSNTSQFNLSAHLDSLGKSKGTRPQHVNITIADDVYVYSDHQTTPALNLSGFGAIQNINHKVKILVKPDGNIIGKSGVGGLGATTGQNGANGGDAIKMGNGIEVYIENYGIIAGGGGGGGGGGYPVNGVSSSGGIGGTGAGWNSGAFISESSSDRNGTNASTALGIHGGNGGLLGQLGTGAGGYNDDSDASQNVANPGTHYSQYAQSGNGGEPGSAIIGYDASRVSFINTGSVFGDSAFKLKA